MSSPFLTLGQPVYPAPPYAEPARLTLLDGPAVEPISVAELTDFARLGGGDSAATLGLFITAARRYFENITGLCLMPQQWQAGWDSIPLTTQAGAYRAGGIWGARRQSISLLKGPVLTIDQVNSYDPDGADQVFPATEYRLGNGGNARAAADIAVNPGSSWPDLGAFPQAFRVTFTAGFSAAALTSGTLTVGAIYRIVGFVAGDSFTNVGAASNASGVTFTATGTTPTDWTHASSLILIDPANVPADIRVALLMLSAAWYENRLPLTADGLAEVPLHFSSLLEMHRLSHIA